MGLDFKELVLAEKGSNYKIFKPIKNQKLLAEIYSAADVFLICSKRENFPTTCVEAQCCGTPVVGFDTGGTKETSVMEGDWFVKYGDVEGLRIMINKILERKENIAKRAANRYSRNNMGENYSNLYRKISEKQQMRLLLIDVNCKKGSTGKITYDLYQYMNQAGNRAAVCYGRGERINEENIFKFGLDWETNVHAALSRVTGYNGCFSFFSTRRLMKYIDEFQPDLIHIHELHAYFVNIKTLINYIKKKRIKLVWTFHCEYMYTGKCGYAYNCNKWEQGCYECPALRDYPKSFFIDQTMSMYEMKRNLLSDLDVTIVTPSKWLADRVKKSFLKEKEIVVINNGIDTEIFHPICPRKIRKILGIPETNHVVCSVAPDIMSERKGGQWVLKLAKAMKDEKISFILVG